MFYRRSKVADMSNSEERLQTSETKQLSRRSFMPYASGIGLTSPVLSGALWAKVADDKVAKVTKAMLQEAEQLAGLEFTDDERELMVDGLNSYLEDYEELREVPLDNSIVPALQFNPVPAGMTFERKTGRLRMSKRRRRKAPSDLEDLAFWPVTDLARLIRARKVRPTELTKMYLDRLKRYDPSGSFG